MSSFEEFQSNVESLPNILQRKYALLGNLDNSLHQIQRQNEQRCEKEIEDMKQSVNSGNFTLDTSLRRFSDDALEEQRHCIRIADEKIALASQAYDLVDAHVQQLDQYLRKLDEELQRERESAAAFSVPVSDVETSMKSGRGGQTKRGGRKKMRPEPSWATDTRANTKLASTFIDLPVDPNEPTYCFCNQVSYGEMVACDNPDCKIEWFHYGCVDLKEQPKGKWYCSDCFVKRRKGK